jgi:hypothetical protein
LDVVCGGLGDRALGLAQRALRWLRGLREWPPERLDEELIGLLIERKGGRLAGAAHHSPGGGRKTAQVLDLAAGGARAELRDDPRGEQQLQPEREPVGRAGAVGIRVEQHELVGEQREHLGMRLGGFEQPGHGVAGARGRVEGGGVIADLAVSGHRIGARDREQFAAARLKHHADAKERFEPGAEAAPGAADPLRDRAQAAVARCVQVEDSIGFAVADRAQDDRLGLQWRGHRGYLTAQ